MNFGSATFGRSNARPWRSKLAGCDDDGPRECFLAARTGVSDDEYGTDTRLSAFGHRFGVEELIRLIQKESAEPAP
jgi:hypothetical protein